MRFLSVEIYGVERKASSFLTRGVAFAPLLPDLSLATVAFRSWEEGVAMSEFQGCKEPLGQKMPS